jgi:hypothetical protein
VSAGFHAAQNAWQFSERSLKKSKHRGVNNGEHIFQHILWSLFSFIPRERKSSDFTCSHITKPVSDVRPAMET